ncbi:iron complex outermembrane receptor protein [Sphingobium xenophagum]|uniref:Iron complex outermembrane receptor protein n=1 Tax=Sphingobium xenophagum TaxID=121428 RepID=A0ABU1X4K0_SPHXE|nr:TonB-dependent receptor [Sphingobium xenophagum]MDR7156499.1 iron complex outermembrane receptor protein [Sphingobium xenophagum]
MKEILKAGLIASISTCAIVVSQPAIAQSAQQPVASNDPTGDIIVTARRTNENLQSVPVAISVLSSDDLEKQRILGAKDMQYNAPSLVVSDDPLGGSTAPVFQLRGQIPAQGSDDTVVTYLGDVPVNSRAFAGGLFDLQSVQILRGPQGTLFGKNSTGGAVIFTPRLAESTEVSGFADASYGNYDFLRVAGGVNVPLVEGMLAVRVSGQITRQDGFIKNLSGPDGANKRNEVARVSLVATPSDEFRNEVYYSYFHGRQQQNPLFYDQIGYGLIAFVAGVPAANVAQAQFDRQKQLGDRTIDYSFGRNNDDNDVHIITNTTSYDFGDMTLKNIFGYINQKPRVRLSQTSTNLPLVDVEQNKDQHSISNELQLSGDTGSLKWIVGGFYSKENTRTKQQSWLFGGLATRQRTSDRYSSKALFAQGTYNFSEMGIEGLSFTAGLRHTWDSRVGIQDVEDNSANGFIPSPRVRNEQKYKNWSWTLGLDYQVSRDLLLYVASRHSYKAGGLNLVSSVSPVELQTFRPEKLTDVEAGIKSTVRVGEEAFVRANLAVYRGWYKDMQFQELANCGTVASYVVNAGKGSPKGVEFELDAGITKNLRLGGFYNRTLGKFKTFGLVEPAGCFVVGSGINLNGTDFGNIAKDTVGLNGSYTLPLSDDMGELVLSGNFYHRGRRVGSPTEGQNSAIRPYSIFNARLDFNNIGGSQISAGVWAQNIGDKRYVSYRNNALALTGYDSVRYGDPETYGVDVKIKF